MPSGEEAPGHERRAPGVAQPALTEATGDERGDAEHERHREADVPEVEDRRVERHEHVVLQQRVRARARRSGTVDSSRNGFAGPSISAKKNSATTRPVMIATATSGSFARLRNFTATNVR